MTKEEVRAAAFPALASFTANERDTIRRFIAAACLPFAEIDPDTGLPINDEEEMLRLLMQADGSLFPAENDEAVIVTGAEAGFEYLLAVLDDLDTIQKQQRVWEERLTNAIIMAQGFGLPANPATLN